MEVDVWSRPGASLRAISIFRLAEEEPSLRPSDRGPTGLAAARLGERTGTVPRPAVEELIAGLPAADVARLTALAGELAPERWSALVAAVGEDNAREPLLVGAVTLAVLEQQPPERWLARMREGTADSAPSGLNVLASLLQASGVWSATDVRAAHDRALSPLRPPERMKAVLSFAATEVADDHLRRARLIAEPVAQILPLADAPRTTIHLEQGLAAVATDAGAAELCGLVLLTAVLSLHGAVPVAPSLN